MEGDVVLAKIHRKRYRYFPLQAEILKVLQRKHSHIIGVYKKKNATEGWIKSSRPLWRGDLIVKIPPFISEKSKTKLSPEEQWVSVRLSHYPSPPQKTFKGSVEHFLGKKLDPQKDSLRATVQFQLPEGFPKFPEELQNIKTKTPLSKDHNSIHNHKKRKNLQHLDFCTVDGETAKDFDDAIYVEKNENNFIAFVAVADVSSYVSMNSPMDKEALKRGTSVYFSNTKPIPMLPPVLSEDLCSLMPQKIRLVMVAEMHLHPSGKLESSRFYSASIKSRIRLTYHQVQKFLDGDINGDINNENQNPSQESKNLLKFKKSWEDLKSNFKVQKSLKAASHLTKLLLGEKQKRGALHLNSQNSLLHINSQGEPTKFIENKTLFSHQIIEELMVTANTQVSLYLLKKQNPQILRIHESPEKEGIILLCQQLKQTGLPSSELKAFSGKGNDSSSLLSQLQKLLMYDHEDKALINILLLRTMKKAIYSTDEKTGHFGLALNAYTHFTSPIRRYTDLVIHRILKNTLENRSSVLYTKKELQNIANHLSGCEKKAVQAERFFDSIKKARWAQNNIGKTFQTTANSITPMGIFTFIPEYDLHGLIQRTELGKQGFEFDREKTTFVHCVLLKSYALGDKIDIKIENANIETGKINFALNLKTAFELKPEKKQKLKHLKQRSPKRNQRGHALRRKEKGRKKR